MVFNKLFAEIEVLHDGLPYIIVPDKLSGQVILKAEPDAPGFETLAYYWDLGNAYKMQGPEILYSFTESKPVNIRLLTNIIDKNTGEKKQACISKTIMPGSSSNDSTEAPSSIPHRKDDLRISNIFSYSEESSRKPVFVVQILESEKDVPVKEFVIGPKYFVRKINIGNSGGFSYIIAEELDFMAAYRAYTEASSFGFSNAIIRTYVPSDPGEAELLELKRNYGTSSSEYFVNNGFSISPEATIILDKLVLLLKRNPSMKLKIVAYTEETNNPKADVDLSSRQAGSIVSYMVENGIGSERLSSAGFGGVRPVAPEFPESERLKNRRIDFIVTE